MFKHNIVTTAYQPIRIDVWRKETDYNVFPDLVSFSDAQKRGTDKNSVYGGLIFINSKAGDFRIKDGSIALLLVSKILIWIILVLFRRD